MITGAMIVTKYGDSTKERRLDMICKYYPCFLEIVDSFIEDMEDDIRNEQDYNRRASLGDLGVRVQTSGLSNRTQKEAVRNVSLEHLTTATTVSNLLRTEQNKIFVMSFPFCGIIYY